MLFRSRHGTVTLFAQGMLDDIQVDKKTVTDRKPASYGLTVGAQGPVLHGAAAWTLFYTRVSNLTYRNEDDSQTPIYFGLGTGRNFSDYDQTSLKLMTGKVRCVLRPPVRPSADTVFPAIRLFTTFVSPF